MTNEKDYRHIPADQLALKLAGRTDIDVPHLIRQVEGWQRLRLKVPSWAAVDGLEYPPRLSLEQCSGEEAARYKADVVSRLLQMLPPTGHTRTMTDLTGGLGVDFAALAPLFDRAVYVERQEELCRLARHNFPLLRLGAGVEVVCAEATDYLRTMQPVDLLFLDPARRDSAGRKTVSIQDCQPDLTVLMPQLRTLAHLIVVKLSPMLDIAGALRTLGESIAEVHVVSRSGECKDLLLVITGNKINSQKLATPDGTRFVACDDGRTFTFTQSEEQAACPSLATEVGAWLYEPAAALLKAGAFKLIAKRYSLSKLHPNSHLYTAKTPCSSFIGRSFQVKGVYSFAKADVRALRELTGGRANLTVRNFPMTVAALRKKLKLADGGDTYVFATTLADGHHALIACSKC